MESNELYKWSTDYKRLIKLLKKYKKVAICIDGEFGQAIEDSRNKYSAETIQCFETYDLNAILFKAWCADLELKFIDGALL